MKIIIYNKLNISLGFLDLILVVAVFLNSLVSYTHASEDEDAQRERDERLARKFAPILVLTQNPIESGYKVLQPEPVQIVGAESISNVQVEVFTLPGGRHFYSGPITESPPIIRNRFPGVDYSSNKFAFLFGHETSNVGALPPEVDPPQIFALRTYFDYPGDGQDSWNAEYFKRGGDDANAGWRFMNTVYARVFERPDPSDGYGSVVIKYFSFYPFNDWDNKHEGDWPKINVMVTSRDPDVAEFFAIDYMFHGKSITYYDITDSLSFINIRERISPVSGKYPVVYVSAGGHGHYPTPGHYRNASYVVTDKIGVDDHLTAHGLVLHPKIVNSNKTIAQSYDLVLLPGLNIDSDNMLDNMGLDPEMSWLGADIGWGEPTVTSTLGIGNDSAKGPLYSGWNSIRVNVESNRKYDKSKIPSKYADFHNFPIVGNVTWNGTITLKGDIVIFPGATLTVQPGTVVEFEPETDIHQFTPSYSGPTSTITEITTLHYEPSGSDALRPRLVIDHTKAEIYVYGSLVSTGTATDSIRFRQKSVPTWTGDYA